MSVRIKKIKTVCADKSVRPKIDATVWLMPRCGLKEAPPVPSVYDGTEQGQESANIIGADLVLKDGYYFECWQGRKKDGGYAAENKGDEDADSVDVTIDMYIPLIEPHKSWIFDQTLNREYIVLFKDRNNPLPRIVGEIDNGCMIKIKEQTNPKNGYVVQIVCKELDNFPPSYGGTIIGA